MTDEHACVFCRIVPFFTIWRDRGDREFAICARCWSRVMASEARRGARGQAETEAGGDKAAAAVR